MSGEYGHTKFSFVYLAHVTLLIPAQSLLEIARMSPILLMGSLALPLCFFVFTFLTAAGGLKSRAYTSSASVGQLGLSEDVMTSTTFAYLC